LKEAKASPATSTKLLQFFSDKRKTEYLQLELAAVVDAREPFVKATYQLEGDSVLVFRCYEIFSTLEASIKLQHFPNLHAMANKLVGRSHELLNKFIMEKLEFSQEYNISIPSFLMNCLLACLLSKLLGFLFQRN